MDGDARRRRRAGAPRWRLTFSSAVAPPPKSPRRPARPRPSPATHAAARGRSGGRRDRKSVVSGKSVSVRLDLGGRRIIKKKINRKLYKSDNIMDMLNSQ